MMVLVAKELFERRKVFGNQTERIQFKNSSTNSNTREWSSFSISVHVELTEILLVFLKGIAYTSL